VVADVRSIYQEEPQPAIYFVYGYIGMPSLAIALHTATDTEAESLVPAIRSVLRTIDPAQPMYNVRTVNQIVATATAQPRFQAVVVGLLAAAAVVLAAFGTYSMISDVVLPPNQKIALPPPLAARQTTILRLPT